MALHSMTEYSISIRQRMDRAGIWLSSLCLLHCVLTILVVSVLGAGSHFLLSPEIHRAGLAIALIIAAVAIGWGALRHRRAAPFVTAMVGLTFMGGALAMQHGFYEVVFTMIGVALVATGHFHNMRSHLLAQQ
ncbi:MAG: MerC domain-containing protein [Proteobacteria bacterium]|nr:MerC domain-containing protein [Pseudomonadota bacterium]